MNVKQLRELLAAMPEDMLVILSSDEEGNSFDFLRDVEVSAYSVYEREIDLIHPDDAEGDEEKAVVLWP